MPGRRVIVSPQGGGPLVLFSATLPAATMGVPYLQSITPYAAAGVPPYNPFLLTAQTGADGWAMNVAGVITGTPAASTVRIDNTGAYRTDNLGNVRSST